MNKHQRETDMIVIQLPRSDWEDIIDAVSYHHMRNYGTIKGDFAIVGTFLFSLHL